MNVTITLLSYDELSELFTTRRVHLEAIEAVLARTPRTEETRWQRKLVARARYSTWLDLQELNGA